MQHRLIALQGAALYQFINERNGIVERKNTIFRPETRPVSATHLVIESINAPLGGRNLYGVKDLGQVLIPFLSQPPQNKIDIFI